MAWTDPRTWVAGETVTAALMNTHVRDNLKAVGDPWTAYTPVLTNWTVGNGTIQGFYMQVGQLVWGKVIYTLGSTSGTTSNLIISLPVAKVTDSGFGMPLFGNAELWDNSASAREFQHVAQNSTTELYVSNQAGQRVNGANPWSWATSDKINATFMYEAA